ncbi:UPF0538 protein C2orf76 homolog isoform X2 [Bubalus bubalis]|uniref:UPF0538 protein C2orf76 homolog isoform X2 n=1 Tax=Bubalus bubalis TaxID=89462 RepID=UPI001D12C0B8|nr:UPF0538 protein C2orf76 homolog isoform X2 [Bubalus bubalis]
MRTSPASLATERLFPSGRPWARHGGSGAVPGVVASEAAKRFRLRRASEEFSLYTHVRDSQEHLHMNDIAGLKGPNEIGGVAHQSSNTCSPTSPHTPTLLSWCSSSVPCQFSTCQNTRNCGKAVQDHSGNFCTWLPKM